MTFLSTHEIGTVLGARWARSAHQAVVEPWGVSTDTRGEVAGACFVALSGDVPPLWHGVMYRPFRIARPGER